MLSKTQKTWLWIFGAMFVVPEVLFSSVISFVVLFFGYEMPTIFSLLFKGYYFGTSGSLIIIAIEFVGALGLFIFSIKSNKKLFAILLGIILLILLFLFYFVLSFHPQLVM